jgi:hypothetical protein
MNQHVDATIASNRNERLQWVSVACLLGVVLMVVAVMARGPGRDIAEKANSSPLACNPNVLDFGTVRQSGEFSKQLLVTNLSDRPITITGVSQSCGCTHVDIETPCRLSAGESVTIPVTARISIDGSASAFVDKQIVLQTDSEVAPRRTIAVLARLDKPEKTRIVPGQIELGRFGPWANPTRTIQLQYSNPDELEVTTIRSSNADITVIPSNVRPFEYELRVSLATRPGEIRGNVVFETTRGIVECTIHGEKMDGTFANSSVVVLRAQDKGEFISNVELNHSPDVTPIVTGVTSDIGEIKVLQTEVVRDGVTTIRIALAAPPSTLPARGRLEIEALSNMATTHVRLDCFVLAK